MLSRLHNKLGTAGLVVAMAALVLAVGGTALAAKGALTGKQKREVEKIAKKFAGKPGAIGPQGPAGPAGTQGEKGDPGANGSNGSAGADGSSVTSQTVPVGSSPCLAGGSKFTSASGTTFACNGEEGLEGPPGEDGEEGSPWTAGGVLPPGKAETGTWIVGQVPIVLDEAEEALDTSAVLGAPISFTIPLAEAGEETAPGAFNEFPVTYVPAGETGPAQCESGTASAPKAAPGNLCVYAAQEIESQFVGEVNPENNEFAIGSGKAGTILRFFMTGGGASAYGNWIVRAREG